MKIKYRQMGNTIFDVSGKVAVVTGGTGVLGGSIAESFLAAGAKVVIIARNVENVEKRTEFLRKKFGEEKVLGYSCNVLDIDRLKMVKRDILDRWNGVDILINCAGGNVKGATLAGQQSFFDMNLDLWDEVLNLNLNGSIYPSFIFGEIMAERKAGCIINISSMAALTAITRVPGYSSAKAAVDIGNQNRNALLNDDGSLTERSEKVLARTPMKRFGEVTELNGAAQFLCSDAASFITGIVLPVDGGFSIFSGV